MKKAYLSPELVRDETRAIDVLNASIPAYDLGGNDWGVQDEL